METICIIVISSIMANPSKLTAVQLLIEESIY